MSLSTTPSLPSVRPSFASGYASPLTGGMAHPDLWRGVVGAWCPSLGATGSTLRDLSGSHNHGTLTNTTLSTVWQPDGLDLDGSDDHVVVADSPLLSLSKAVTASAWFNADVAPTGDEGFIRKSSAYTLDVTVGGAIRFLIWKGGGGTQGITTTGIGTDWVMITGTYDGSTLRLYRNGVEAATPISVTATIADSANDLWIGRGFTKYLNGTQDDCLVYNRALTSNEVAKLYRLGPAGIYQQKRPVITTVEPPTVEPAGSVGAFITSEVKPSYASGYASPITGGMAHESLWDGVVGAWCPSLGATGGTLRDLSGRNNHGTLTNFNALSNAWSDPRGLSLDKTYIEHVDTGVALDHTESFTYSAWLYQDTTFRAGILSTRGGLPGTGAVLTHGLGGSGNLTHYHSGGSVATASGVITQNRWHHVASMYDFASDEIRIYVDGMLVHTTTTAGAPGTTSQPVLIGSEQPTANSNTAIIDGATVYNRALTANEVATLHRLGPAGIYQQKRPVITTVEPPTVEPAGSVGAFITSEVKPSYASGYASPITGGMAHESLWDGVVGAWCPSLGATGTTLRDLSGHHHHGTLEGMTPATDWLTNGLDFDGTNSGVDTGATSFHAGDRNTVSAWFATTDAGAGVRRIMGNYVAGQPFFTLYIAEGRIGGYARDNSNIVVAREPSAVSNDGELHHAVFTIRPGEGVLYIDGEEVQVSTNASFDGSVTNNAKIAIGKRHGDIVVDVWLGLIDDVLYYNRTLTPNEVAKLYRLGPGGIYQRKQPVITTAEEVVGGLSIPIAAYHYNHNVGSRL